MLFAKCTTAVAPMATGKSKNKLNTGSNRVPKPNPEKKVKADPNKTTTATMINSIGQKNKILCRVLLSKH